MIRFLKFTSVIFLGTITVSSSLGCRAIYSDDTAVENAFRKDATFDWVGTTRPKDEDNEHFGYSVKARAIEQHMGIE